MPSAALFAALSMLLAGCASIEALAPRGAAEEAVMPEATGDAWYDAGRNALYERKTRIAKTDKAKNVILFIGDGMDISTVTAARIYDGQSRGESGEENILSFETFPYVALVKTYTTDYQVSDSAGTASAMLTGVKTRSGVISINETAPRGDCSAGLNSIVATLAERAEDAGLSTGVVSTARITHATPATAYAHSADRGWESDGVVPGDAKDEGCADIARQLIEFERGDGIDVALGGGRANFLPTENSDPEYPEIKGARTDGRDLTAEWTAKSAAHAYVWNKADFDAAEHDQKLLGLFEPSHMHFEADRPDDGAGEPSLADMTAKAIASLSGNEKGYFLLIEAGRIDHAHHWGNAFRALKDTQAYADAVRIAREATSEDDTLIIVTADHGHTMTIQGYPRRGADILGLAVVGNSLEGDGKPYTTLNYANGPGSVFAEGVDLSDGRPAPENVLDKNYRQQALIPTGSETHGGQDVPVYASGPGAHLVSGVMEQNVIYHIMADALGL